jgi:hypothetical protein
LEKILKCQAMKIGSGCAWSMIYGNWGDGVQRPEGKSWGLGYFMRVDNICNWFKLLHDIIVQYFGNENFWAKKLVVLLILHEDKVLLHLMLLLVLLHILKISVKVYKISANM